MVIIAVHLRKEKSKRKIETSRTYLEDKVLVRKLLAVDRDTTSTIEAGKVTTLEHEVGDNTVEDGVLVVERSAVREGALLT